jgi:hypothetical protein
MGNSHRCSKRTLAIFDAHEVGKEMKGRTLFFVAAAFNWLVALSLVVPNDIAWKIFGMPAPEQKLFLHLFALMAAVFGVAYFWIGRDPAGKRPLILLSVIGKLSVFAVILAHYLAGSVPLSVVGPGLGDLVFAVLFIRFMQHHREPVA